MRVFVNAVLPNRVQGLSLVGLGLGRGAIPPVFFFIIARYRCERMCLVPVVKHKNPKKNKKYKVNSCRLALKFLYRPLAPKFLPSCLAPKFGAQS